MARKPGSPSISRSPEDAGAAHERPRLTESSASLAIPVSFSGASTRPTVTP